MDTRTGFQRSFIIFTNEDSGYESGQKPSGHVKLEVREGRGKLHATVQNLRPGNGRFVYKLYLLRTDRDGVVIVCTGQLMAEPNKAELEWSFNPRNVGSSGYGIDEFDSMVVLAEYEDRQSDAVICPLAAYKNKKVEWRSGFRTAMLKKKMGVLPVAEVINNNSAGSIEAMTDNKTCSDIMEAGKSNAIVDIVEQNVYGNAEAPWQPEMQPQLIPLNQQKQPEAEQPLQQPAALNPQKQPVAEQPLQQQPTLLNPQMQPEAESPLQQQPTLLNPQMQTEVMQPLQQQFIPYQQQSLVPPQEQLHTQYQGNPGQVDTGCVYLNGNICGAFINNGAGAVNPCDTCHMHHAQVSAAVPPVGDVSQLKGEIERYFEECDPFHSKRSDYMWWKVTNPVNLNNMLYQCNIRSPLLFNPAVMMAHYKYRHLIIGIYQHREGQKQYVVCGVPGLHMVDRKPFGEMSRWVQAEGNRPRYGAFGYWLVYIDPDDGRILNMS